MDVNEINEIIRREKLDTNLISDGYHTFGELYDHRFALFIAFCNFGKRKADCEGFTFTAWKSRKHHDGTSLDGWFIAGINKDKGKQISYHLPEHMWDKLGVHELDQAPEWDGHTPNDVVKRLLNFSGLDEGIS